MKNHYNWSVFKALAGIACISFLDTDTPLHSHLIQLKNDPVLKKGNLSFMLMDVKTGRVLESVNPDLPMTPASSLKLITCAAALDLLGPSFQYETRVCYSGKYDKASGLLDGDLLIVGEGDPTLGSRQPEEWVTALKKTGLKEIKGKIIADARAFDDSLAPYSWPEADVGNYYGAGACGINFKENSYDLFFNTGAAGTKAKFLYQDPRIPGMSFRSEVKAGGSSDQAYIYGKEYTYERLIKGTLPPNKTAYKISGSMPDPALYVAYTMDSLLKAAGIKTLGYGTHQGGLPSGDPAVLLSHRSQSMSDIIAQCLKRSQNLYAESVLKTLGRVREGQGSRRAGIRAMKTWLDTCRVSSEGLNVLDGSGLSPANRITARQFCTALHAFSSTQNFSHIFHGMKQDIKGVYLKSGYINGVRAYCGYVERPAGRLYAFAFMANDFSCSAKEMRLKMEKILNALSTY